MFGWFLTALGGIKDVSRRLARPACACLGAAYQDPPEDGEHGHENLQRQIAIERPRLRFCDEYRTRAHEVSAAVRASASAG